MNLIKKLNILLSATFEESYSNLYKDLRNYNSPQYYIHFTDGVKDSRNDDVPVIQINPKKYHNDIHAIYAYPISWLLKNFDGTGFQYGVSKKFYYIIKLKKSKNGLNFRTITDYELSKLAKNGNIENEYRLSSEALFRITNNNIVWKQIKKWIKTKYTELSSKESEAKDIISNYISNNMFVEDDNFLDYIKEVAYYTIFRPIKTQSIEKYDNIYCFYLIADLMCNSNAVYIKNLPKRSWTQIFKGIDYIIDTTGIINNNEPSQLVILNKKYIDIIKVGENKDNTFKNNDSVFDSAIKELGGSWKFLNDKYYFEYEYDNTKYKGNASRSLYDWFLEDINTGTKYKKRFEFSYIEGIDSKIIKKNIVYALKNVNSKYMGGFHIVKDENPISYDFFENFKNLLINTFKIDTNTIKNSIKQPNPRVLNFTINNMSINIELKQNKDNNYYSVDMSIGRTKEHFDSNGNLNTLLKIKEIYENNN
jgi:hypothetical protein